MNIGSLTHPRVLGIETEYGISVPGQASYNATLASSQVVNGYCTSLPDQPHRRPRWDYDEETPLRDARGFDMSRSDADPTQLTDDDLGLANAVLTNGARLYVDHAHPEYSSPEVLTPSDAVVYDRAGELIMQTGAATASLHNSGLDVRVYKNNTDNKGASYGTHENYLLIRAVPFSAVVDALVPFFITRQVICGAGRLGRGQDGRDLQYQISQRADFFEEVVGLETTLKRPIINTRDEPHADPAAYRRLHVIVGDANLADTANYLKLGTTALVMGLIETGRIPPGLSVADPVAEMHAVSHDPQLLHKIGLESGQRCTAIEIQYLYWEAACELVRDSSELLLGGEAEQVLGLWESVLKDLDADPMSCVGRLDWVTKLDLLQAYRRRDGLDWKHPRLALIDLQYSEIHPTRGIARKLESTGRLHRLVAPEAVTEAVTTAPSGTRAWFRGECVRRYGENLAAASWDSVVFDLGPTTPLKRLSTLDPLRGSREAIEPLMDSCADASALLDALSRGTDR